MKDEDTIRTHYELLRPSLNERDRRLFAASLARSLGRGGIKLVSRATGIARSTINRGLKDIDRGDRVDDRIRRQGGGCKSILSYDPSVLNDLRQMVDPATRGDPEQPLKWVSKSLAKLARALQGLGHTIGPTTVSQLLKKLEYSRKGNRKTLETANHPDRDAQFEHINKKVLEFQASGQPVISVDTKKKELIGNFKNGGTEWEPKGKPTPVEVHDFPKKESGHFDNAEAEADGDDAPSPTEGGKVVPYGIYDQNANNGWVSVGISHDTAEFAVNGIRIWHDKMGKQRYPYAGHLLITADGGGSNGSRVRLWKLELQSFADETGITIEVCHYPPGTSKWNKIEHRMFCHISQNWRARPLISRMTVVDLIAATTTKTGLTVAAGLDTRVYQKGRKVTDAEMSTLNIQRDKFHPEWNYVIAPRKQE